MPKFLCLIVLLLSACTGAAQEQKFVNPLFYEKLEPVSGRSWVTYLTPTQFKKSNARYDKVGTCELLENTQDKISLKCTWYNDISESNVTYIYIYTISECEERNRIYGRWCVIERVGAPDEDLEFFSRALFTID